MAKISLIGSGNTATALGMALAGAGHQISEVWSRNTNNAATLAKGLNATACAEISAIKKDAGIYIIAVKDDAIEEVATKLKVGDKIVVHTSGIKSKDILTSVSANYGIFYPFISMTKDIVADFDKSLIMIEGNNENTIKVLQDIAKTISGNIKVVEENQRQSLHLAAVFAQNFTNHLYIISEKILADKGFDFNGLRPLIAAHLSKLQAFSPSKLQTGPAIRHDSETIATHLKLLGDQIDFKQLYLTMTEAIQQMHPIK